MGIDFQNSRKSIEEAKALAVDLELLLQAESELVGTTKKAASQAKSSQVLLELAKLPIDKLKDATEETVRIETLRKYGFTNVAAVYNSSATSLEKIPGISESSAITLKLLAEQMYEAIAQSIAYGINIDELTSTDTELLTSLQGLDQIRSATRNSISKMAPVVEKVKGSLAQTKPLK